MIFQNEVFIELEKYPGYFISKSWLLIRDTEKGLAICAQTPNSKKDPYWSVTVRTITGKYVKRSMHRLLMETFVCNPENKEHVNHINGDKACREFSNLEWATPKENAIHARQMGLTDDICFYIPVYQYYLDGEYIASYDSACIAQRMTGIAKTNISKCSLGFRDHAGGYIWLKDKAISAIPLGRKIVSHFNVSDKQGNTKKYKYIGLWYKNPNPKAAHPILKEMGNSNTLHYNKYFIERIYYK